VLAYLQAPDVDSHFRLVSRDGKVLGTVGPEAHYSLPQVSRDGDRIIFIRDDSAWLLDLVRGTSTRLTTEQMGPATSTPAWFRDDTAVLTTSVAGIVLKELAGGHSELIFSSSDSEQAQSLVAVRDPSVSPDGSLLTFSAWDPVTDYDLWVLRLGDESEPQRLAATPRVQQAPSISPNGQWIAYESDESGRHEVYVRPAGPGDTKWLISTGGGTAPLWSEDGTELFYISSDDEMMAVSIAGSASRFEAGLPTALFRAPLAPPLNRSMNVVVEPRLAGLVDGTFLFQVPAGDLPPRTITVVLNWQQLLKR
jgi:Tol biopolymer transport system component